MDIKYHSKKTKTIILILIFSFLPSVLSSNIFATLRASMNTNSSSHPTVFPTAYIRSPPPSTLEQSNQDMKKINYTRSDIDGNEILISLVPTMIPHNKTSYHYNSSTIPTHSPISTIPTSIPANYITSLPTKYNSLSPTGKVTSAPTKDTTSSPTGKVTSALTEDTTLSPTANITSASTEATTSYITENVTSSTTEDSTSILTGEITSSTTHSPVSQPSSSTNNFEIYLGDWKLTRATNDLGKISLPHVSPIIVTISDGSQNDATFSFHTRVTNYIITKINVMSWASSSLMYDKVQRAGEVKMTKIAAPLHHVEVEMFIVELLEGLKRMKYSKASGKVSGEYMTMESDEGESMVCERIYIPMDDDE